MTLLAGHNKENEHNKCLQYYTIKTVNLPKQHNNDVLLDIPNVTEVNAELPFLTEEEVTDFLDNCKNARFLNLDNNVAMWQDKTPSDKQFD